MPNYVYTLSNNRKPDERGVVRCLLDVAEDADHTVLIYEALLKEKRESRYAKLVAWREEKEDLEQCLPEEYKPHAHDINLLKALLCSVYELHKTYSIKDLHEEKCYGCLYNSSDRSDHTVCPTGCEHDLDRCWLCA